MQEAELRKNFRHFENEAHLLLGRYESAVKSRTVTLKQTYDAIQGLSINQDDLFRMSLRCVENGLYKAAYVMSFSAMMDYLEEWAEENNFSKLRKARPKWIFKDIEELRDSRAEYAIIEAMHAAGFFCKAVKKGLHGDLSIRNECAHPTSFFPDLNMSLGYISDLLGRIKTLNSKRGI